MNDSSFQNQFVRDLSETSYHMKGWFMLYATLHAGVSVALLVVLTLVSSLSWADGQRTVKDFKRRNFQQNGGDMLLRQLSERQGYAEKTKIFTEVELKNATDDFHEDRIIGGGGPVIVYKGVLSSNNTPIAIKKSIVGGNSGQIRDLISEVVMFSQISHKNVVRLLGCCLETEAPILVYVFVDNGTILDRIDPMKTNFPILWEIRLRIATETVEAISYSLPL